MKKSTSGFQMALVLCFPLTSVFASSISDCMKGTLKINCKRFHSCSIHFQEELPPRFAHAIHYQPTVIAAGELHKN